MARFNTINSLIFFKSLDNTQNQTNGIKDISLNNIER